MVTEQLHTFLVDHLGIPELLLKIGKKRLLVLQEGLSFLDVVHAHIILVHELGELGSFQEKL
jgi:hypothetical protein